MFSTEQKKEMVKTPFSGARCHAGLPIVPVSQFMAVRFMFLSGPADGLPLHRPGFSVVGEISVSFSPVA
jgi:hypothetical protein